MPKRAHRSTNKRRESSETGRLRIVSGHLRSRIIEFATDPRTRPMKDRTREALFSLLGGHLDGYIAADLFAGSGILAFEALSRGAAFAVAVELLANAARELRLNAERLGIADQFVAVHADTFQWASTGIELMKKQQSMAIDGCKGWCVFSCPPYKLWQEAGDKMKTVMQSWVDAAPVGSYFAIELDLSTSHELLPSGIEWETRDYPPATLAIGEKE